MLVITRAVHAVEVIKTGANETMARIAKTIMPAVAEVLSFIFDLLAYITKDPYAWRKPYHGYKKELIHEQTQEFVVKRGGEILICRKIFLVYAIRGKNRRDTEYRYTYRSPTAEDLQQTEIIKQISELH